MNSALSMMKGLVLHMNRSFCFCFKKLSKFVKLCLFVSLQNYCGKTNKRHSASSKHDEPG